MPTAGVTVPPLGGIGASTQALDKLMAAGCALPTLHWQTPMGLLMVASEEKKQTAAKVLAKIAAYDPFFVKPSEAVWLAWAESLTIANIPEELALEAVARMYVHVDNSQFRPLPGLLIQYCREIRRERVAADPPPIPDKSVDPLLIPPNGAVKISMEEWEDKHGQSFPEIVLGRPIPGMANPLRVHCRHCKAGIGSPCVVPGTNEVLSKSRCHPCRQEDAEQAYA